MSAEVLREAAALMRERAGRTTPGPWSVPDPDDEYMGPFDVVGDGEPGDRYIVCEHAGSDAEHIASWHPVVALAVAEALDDRAMLAEVLVEHGARGITEDDRLLVVARAYLGRGA